MNTQPVLEAQHADGFVDFYTLIAAAPSVGDEELREQINALYKDAQTDRDHRTPARRREAQLLLEWLPQARTILLDPKRRRRYDAYRGAVEMQSPRMPFEEFLPALLNERETTPDAADILSVSRRSVKTAAAPVVEVPVVVQAPVVVEPTPAPVVAAPVVAPPASPSPAKPAKPRLPMGSVLGGAGTFFGLIATLPTLASLPVGAYAPLAIMSAIVVGYVFSLTGELALETS
ncbi:hypothetical protein IAD21_03603 [Abditibacteriota bacterium]|nr:hypothetical protein IAD21_03603 [Abditibacteriota bacterium]